MPPPATPDTPAVPYCTFRLGELLFGLEVRHVKEVSLPPPVTPVPHAPEAVVGYVNLRGHVHLVLDPKRLLGLGAVEPGPGSRLVLFKAGLGDPFGVIVDQVGEIVTLRPEQVEPRRTGDGLAEVGRLIDAGLVTGVGKPDGELLVLLDAGRFLQGLGRGDGRGGA
jgi:purine-binding chemotaxis protein CheW